MTETANPVRCHKVTHRIASFRQLPGEQWKPVPLARNGFYYSPQTSQVMCYMCGAIIPQDANPEDHPELLHNPGCEFEDVSDSVTTRPLTSRELIQRLKRSGSAEELDPPSAQSTDSTRDLPAPDPPIDPRLSPDSEFFHKMREESLRLETFHDFTSSVVSKNLLAEDGFFYLGARAGDRVQCAFCKGVLRNWEAGDIPKEEHKKHFKDCAFVQGKNVNNVPIPKSNSEPSSPSHSVISSSVPKCPQYADSAKRLDSYKNWPRNKLPAPRTLMEAGFYFSGVGDQVKCYFCDGGLRNWEAEEDPKAAHIRWFPKCPLVAEFKKQAPQENGTAGADSANVADNATRYRVNASVIKACMAKPIVKEIRGMGFTQDEVYEAFHHQLTTTGEDFAADSDLVEAVLAVRDHKVQAALGGSKPASDPTSNPQSGPSKSKKKKKRMKKKPTEREGSPRPEAAPTPPPEEPPTDNRNDQSGVDITADKVDELMRENAAMREARQCKVCMDNDIGIVFLPCGHLVCCPDCAALVRDCPVCRALIKGTVRVFPS